MGGCCCSSRKPHLHGTPVYYYCPPSLEERGSLISPGGAASAFTAGLLVEFNLNTSTPDTFRSPPAPLPYDVVFGGPRSSNSDSIRETISRDSFETVELDEDIEESDRKIRVSSLPVSPRKSNVIRAIETVSLTIEEDDICPICLEDYDSENPVHITKCEHHFHLPCVLEWMERSDTCPMCDQDASQSKSRMAVVAFAESLPFEFCLVRNRSNVNQEIGFNHSSNSHTCAV